MPSPLIIRKNNGQFCLDFTVNQHPAFLQSIVNVLPASYIGSHSCIFFYATNISLTNPVLSHHSALDTIDSLTKQLHYLEANHVSWYGFDDGDLMFVNNLYTIMINPERIAQIKEHRMLIIAPFTYCKYIAPEIAQLTHLPANMHINAAIYAIGSYVKQSLSCLYSDPLLLTSKIGAFLRRATADDINARYLIYI